MTVLPDHLEVTVVGAPPLNILLSEAGLKESDCSRRRSGGLTLDGRDPFDPRPANRNIRYLECTAQESGAISEVS